MTGPEITPTPPPTRPTSDPPLPRASWPGLGLGLFAVLALSAAGFYAGWAPRQRNRAQVEADTRDLAVPTVIVVAPQPAAIPPGLELPAELKPWKEAGLFARASGFVRRLRVDLGAQVKAGDVLAELGTPELDLELAGARYELAQAEQSAALAKVNAARAAGLRSKGLVSGQDDDEAQSNLAVSRSRVDTARAKVERLRQLKAFGTITAPFAGKISARRVDVGELIAAGGSKELFRLVQTSPLRVFVRVPQSMALALAPDQAARLTVPDLPGRSFPVRVLRTAGEIASESRTLLVELQVDNTRGELLPGSFALVRFDASTTPSALTVPGNALLFRAEGPRVGVVSADGKVALRPVKLGRDWGDQVEILSGLGQTDRVILNPSDSLADGSQVRIKPAVGGPTPR